MSRTGMALFVGLLAGCGSEPEFATVEGVVTSSGKPLTGVEVSFLPDPERGNSGPRSVAYTDEHGRYKLWCERVDKEGAVVGPHRVCVIDPAAVASLAENPRPGAISLRIVQLRVSPDYGNATRTPLRVEVVPGQQRLDFNLPRKLRQ